MAELKPCPFCGSTNVRVGDTKTDAITAGVVFPGRLMIVECMECFATAGFFRVKKCGVKGAREKAIAFWNRRADNGEADK